jgi:hypothetical protein
MSLNPSNLIARENNPGRTTFPNLARHHDGKPDPEVEEVIRQELASAGIESHSLPRTIRGEVPTYLVGELCLWGFTRAWYYWVAEGPGIPPDVAQEFWKGWGKEVRTDGHCGCPSPLEWKHGFAIGSYHIDTLEGLAAFAQLLKSIYLE